ncbi:uncharacterized protein LY79DRAFT_140435 [Colletotrichum navitas]|uniref:Uncharacterized protein n=1 Tax=Colletotrichum navitas TaxID=681940 RepID=A0AAD8V9K9_9PEZI|nr:uncharacterized protein LY79DRAFT_140435 [Colletotrichum navitas]KAK1599417.1 hypothetical protein LY79DRAFT_140435 [Colletotrichum navitas]
MSSFFFRPQTNSRPWNINPAALVSVFELTMAAKTAYALLTAWTFATPSSLQSWVVRMSCLIVDPSYVFLQHEPQWPNPRILKRLDSNRWLWFQLPTKPTTW